MAGRPLERKLRRAAAELEALPAEDFDAILTSLEAGQRTRLVAMLGETNATAQTRPPSRGRPSEPGPGDGLSPWLAARIRASEDGIGMGQEITADSAAVLKRCAAARAPQAPKRSRLPSPSPSPSLTSRLAAKLGLVSE